MAVIHSAALAAIQIRRTISKGLEALEIASGKRDVYVCVSDCHGAGLLLQYHAPLADELLCSSLVPLSPNQTCHNISQRDHKWERCLFSLDQSVIRHISQILSSAEPHLKQRAALAM